MPVSAAPKLALTIAISEIGVSTTRSGPKRANEPLSDLERAAVDPNVFADAEHRGVALHLFPDLLWMASR